MQPDFLLLLLSHTCLAILDIIQFVPCPEVQTHQVLIQSQPIQPIYASFYDRIANNGRFIPITEEARRVIKIAKDIPGDSPYLFHEENCSKMIPTDGYIQNLRYRCRRLGCVPTNNHAFRMAFNSRLIELGFSASDRALILGHEVQTNEAHYSLTDKRRLNDIKERLNKEEP